jgi:hypothetical protein
MPMRTIRHATSFMLLLMKWLAMLLTIRDHAQNDDAQTEAGASSMSSA